MCGVPKLPFHVHFVRSLHELQPTMEQHTDRVVGRLIDKSIDDVQKPFPNPIVRIGTVGIGDTAENVFAVGLKMNVCNFQNRKFS